MLLWVIECAELNGHSLDGLRGHWRPLEAEETGAKNLFSQIWAYGVCYYGLLNLLSLMGMVSTASKAEIFFSRYGHVEYATMGY